MEGSWRLTALRHAVCTYLIGRENRSGHALSKRSLSRWLAPVWQLENPQRGPPRRIIKFGRQAGRARVQRTATAGNDGDILVAASAERDRRRTRRRVQTSFPQRLAGRRVIRCEMTILRAAEHNATRRRQHRTGDRRALAIAPQNFFRFEIHRVDAPHLAVVIGPQAQLVANVQTARRRLRGIARHPREIHARLGERHVQNMCARIVGGGRPVSRHSHPDR